MIRRGRAVLLAGAGVAALALAACGGGTGAGSAGGGGSSSAGGAAAKEIKVVIAEYSKDHTAAFWNAFKAKYEKAAGVTLNLQIISWNDIDQQTSTMVQNNQPPDILNLNVYASYAKDGLLYSSDEVLPPATKADLIDAFVNSGTYQGKMLSLIHI